MIDTILLLIESTLPTVPFASNELNSNTVASVKLILSAETVASDPLDSKSLLLAIKLAAVSLIKIVDIAGSLVNLIVSSATAFASSTSKVEVV